MLFSGLSQATLHHEHLVARGTYHASVMGEPTNGRNVVSAGSTSFRIADDTIGQALATCTGSVADCGGTSSGVEDRCLDSWGVSRRRWMA
jgi:hypothetical protein